MLHKAECSTEEVPYCFSRSSIKFHGHVGQNKANLRDLITATGLVIFLKFDPNHRFSARMTLKFDGWPRKIIGHLFYTTSSFVHHFKSIGEFKLLNSGQNWRFLSRVTSKFYGWPWKTIGYLFYSTSSFAHHFKAMGEFKLKLLSGNAQFGSKLEFFLSRVTFKFDRWPWKTKGHLFYTTSSFVHHFKAMSEFNLEFQFGNAQFWSKSAIFCPAWPWNLMDDLEKQ